MKPVQSVPSDPMNKLQGLLWLVRKAGPYLALEILMPGGTLLALLLFLYRRHAAAPDGTTLALRAAASRLYDEVRARMAPMRALVRQRASV